MLKLIICDISSQARKTIQALLYIHSVWVVYITIMLLSIDNCDFKAALNIEQAVSLIKLFIVSEEPFMFGRYLAN